jgi:hypothetical protein
LLALSNIPVICFENANWNISIANWATFQAKPSAVSKLQNDHVVENITQKRKKYFSINPYKWGQNQKSDS